MTTTLAQDEASEFDGANRIARAFLHYVSIWAQLKVSFGFGDTVYLSYHDGKIAKFKVVSPTNTILLQFQGPVDSVPSDAQRNGFSLSNGGAPLEQDSVGMSMRADYVDSNSSDWFYETYEKRPSVTIIQYNLGGSGACSVRGCYDDTYDN